VSPGGVPLLGSVWFLYADGRFCIPSTGTIAGTAAQVAAWVSSPGH
jgi:hypothetical protein